jgi:hypothetical protein
MADQITGEITLRRELDPMLSAIAQLIIDAQVTAAGADLTDFTEKNVIVLPPDATDKAIDGAVQKAIAKHKGLALTIIGGEAKNPDTAAPGPRAVIGVELQLFVHPALRAKGSRTPLELVVALMRGLHDAQIRITGFPWYEEVKWTGYAPLPDPDFIAYSINFDREMAV